jgi:hypothetical protein
VATTTTRDELKRLGQLSDAALEREVNRVADQLDDTQLDYLLQEVFERFAPVAWLAGQRRYYEDNEPDIDQRRVEMDAIRRGMAERAYARVLAKRID